MMEPDGLQDFRTTSSVRAVVSAGCRHPRSNRIYRERPRLKGDTELLDRRVVLRIRSRAWLDRLRERRPAYAYLSRQEAGGHFTYSDSVAIEYLEPGTNEL